MRRLLGADIAAGADNILDKELLTEMLRESFRQEPGKDIARSAGAKGDDDAHRVRRIGLGPRGARRCREEPRLVPADLKMSRREKCIGTSSMSSQAPIRCAGRRGVGRSRDTMMCGRKGLGPQI